jgi:hypothetical protein
MCLPSLDGTLSRIAAMAVGRYELELYVVLAESFFQLV